MIGRIVLILAALAGLSFGCAGGSTAQPGGASIRLAVVGDTHGYNIVDNPAVSGRDLLAGVRDVLDDADVLLLNHEGTLIDPTDVGKHCRTFERQSTFASPPTFAQLLDAKPRVVASLGNNHAMDCGAEGLAQTRRAFAQADIPTVGAGSNIEEACRPVQITVDGVDIAFVSYLDWGAGVEAEGVAAAEQAPGVATLDACDAEATIRRLAPESLVVASLHAHFALSWTYETAPEHLAAVRQLLEWGADVVVSHGPHFPQAVLADDGQLAFLSLGNFMFHPDYEMPPEAHESLVALLEVANGRVVEARLYPIEVTEDGLPVLAREPAAGDILSRVAELSARYDVDIELDDGVGVVEAGGP
jgi:poly-gamma-glutamate capsule biosynthesis protein CapA/YwtB (metallophosphatase superfamily)